MSLWQMEGLNVWWAPDESLTLSKCIASCNEAFESRWRRLLQPQSTLGWKERLEGWRGWTGWMGELRDERKIKMESVEDDQVMRKDDRLASRTRTLRERETRIVVAAVNILYITNELSAAAFIPFQGKWPLGLSSYSFLSNISSSRSHQLINPSSMDYYSWSVNSLLSWIRNPLVVPPFFVSFSWPAILVQKKNKRAKTDWLTFQKSSTFLRKMFLPCNDNWLENVVRPKLKRASHQTNNRWRSLIFCLNIYFWSASVYFPFLLLKCYSKFSFVQPKRGNNNIYYFFCVYSAKCQLVRETYEMIPFCFLQQLLGNLRCERWKAFKFADEKHFDYLLFRWWKLPASGSIIDFANTSSAIWCSFIRQPFLFLFWLPPPCYTFVCVVGYIWYHKYQWASNLCSTRATLN